jgi:Flp pilus assembly protein TadG
MTFRSSTFSRDGGTMSLEMVIVVPIFVAFLMLLAGLGRIVDAQSQVDSAARDAVRAASIARSEGGAQSLGKEAAQQSLDGHHRCTNNVRDDTLVSGDWQPGGQITVTVHCVISLSDVGFIGFPGTKAFDGKATAPIDKYTFRGGGGSR